MFDQHNYLYKAKVFGVEHYDDDHKKHATFYPGFKFVAMPGADLMVVGVLNKDACLDEMDDVKRNLPTVASTFFRQLLNPALLTLSPECRTRQHNLAMCGRRILPRYYRLYPEDINELFASIRARMRARNGDILFDYFFVYYKYGQQLRFSLPFSLQTVSINAIVASMDRVECISCHLAMTFGHVDDNMSVLWDLDKTASAFRGRKYPLFGLGEVGNVTSVYPLVEDIVDAWPYATRDAVIVTYLQAYTPLTKAMDFKPFADHPYLIYNLLGMNYVRSRESFKHIAESVDEKKDYIALQVSRVG